MANAISAAHDRSDADLSPVDSLMDHLADAMQQVDATILARMDSPVAMIPDLAGHLVSSGGKRIRPLLTLACADLLNYTGDRHITLGAIVEFIHTATLLHDDVVDQSEMRRGKRTANLIWGNQPSVLVGDFLFSRAFQLMVEDGSLEVLRILSGASAVIAEGEVLQLQAAQDITTTEDTYLNVVSAKTAALFAAACEVAAVIAGRSADDQAALRAYGEDLGIAFQIADDALDYASSAAVMGKAVGDDFRDGKVTLPVIRAYACANATEQDFWRRVIKGARFQQDGDLDHALDLMTKANAIESSYRTAYDYAARAKAALDRFPKCAVRDMLCAVADHAVARQT